MLIKLVVLLNWLRFWGRFTFRVVPATQRIPRGWAPVHHQVVGRNGGCLLIPREAGVIWPNLPAYRLLVQER